MSFNEFQFAKQAEGYILKCRPGDWAHAQRVVQWVKEIGADREDLPLLIMAAYVHDIGWFNLVPADSKLSKEELLKFQPLADKQTKELIIKVLTKEQLTATQIEKILRLIRATESYLSTQTDEEILVDADNLSKTDPDHVKEKYVPADWLKMCNLFEEKLPHRIKTVVGKKLFPAKLAKLRIELEKSLDANQR